MKTLLHICCAPCANMCIDTLRQEGQDVTGFWYTPNIHPFTEYWSLRPFVRAVADDIANRCVKCYEMRLMTAAEYAAANGYDAFTSSLFISPYQKHELMKEVAERAADTYRVRFLYRDFRPYFKQGQERARELGFYMQKYCGCVFSEEERYLKASKIIP